MWGNPFARLRRKRLQRQSGSPPNALSRGHDTSQYPDRVADPYLHPPERDLAVVEADPPTPPLDHADPEVHETQDDFPHDLKDLTQRVTSALQGTNWREALQWLAVMREMFPDEISGYTSAGHALRHLARCDEADKIEEEGLTRFPGNLELLTSYAWTAMVRQDWQEAERRWWNVLAGTPPGAATGYIGLAELFRQQGRLDQNEAVLQFGMSMLPDSAPIAEAFAMSATWRGDWPAAVQRWRQVCTRFPDSGVGHHQLGVALKQTGQTDAAESALADGMQRVPNYVPLAMEHAWCANSRNDWPEALRRWQALAARFPADVGIEEGLLDARTGALANDVPVTAEVSTTSWHDPGNTGATETNDPGELLGNFESLGGNCEFGLVQRYFGIEPISLFRWVAMGIGSVTDAVESELDGIGGREQTIIEVSSGNEYFVRDKRYDFVMHTFVQKETIEAEKFHDQQCRRLIFLRRRLLEELAANQKIFVRFEVGDVDDMDVLRLCRALRRHGSAVLLHVRLHDAAHPPGTVERAGPSLLIGYIERFGPTIAHGWDIAYDSWLAICRAAYALRVSDPPPAVA